MFNHTTLFPGTRVFTYYPAGTKSSTPVTAGRDIVSGHSIVIGDNKKANTFGYEAINEDNYNYEYVERYNGDLVQTITGVYTDRSLRSDIVIPNLDNFLYNSALSRLNEKVRGQLDISITLAQSSQTLRMIGGLNKLTSYVSRSGFGPLGTILKTGGKNWLLYQYGWRPLIQDIYAAADELVRQKLPEVLIVRSKAKDDIKDLKIPGLLVPSVKHPVNGGGVQGVKFKIRYKEKDGAFDYQRWSSLNPISIAWELVPYSFVVDWMYDIGGMLRSLETALLYDSMFVDGYYTTLKAYYGECDFVERQGLPQYLNKMQRVKSRVKHVKFGRVRLGSYPLPRLPTFKVQLGPERWISAAALLSQHLR